MCHARLIFLLPVLPLALLAENMTTTGETPFPPPSYKILRFDEDYSCLTNPAIRSDWFDPVKYIPLRENEPYWYLSFGGELRERFEGIHDDNFGIGSGPDCDGQILVTTDLLGTFPWFTPKFVKPRLNAADQMRAAIEEWKKSI